MRHLVAAPARLANVLGIRLSRPDAFMAEVEGLPVQEREA
jgi:hypothetical protein